MAIWRIPPQPQQPACHVLIVEDIVPKTSAETGSGSDAKSDYPSVGHSRAETGSGSDTKTSYPPASHLRTETGAGAELSALLAALMTTAIDIGNTASDRASAQSSEGLTIIDRNNPANDVGVLDTVEFWFNTNASNTTVGTFYGSGTSNTSRGSVTIGAVSSGSKQTFTGLNIQVSTNDLIGWYCNTGKIERDTSGTGVYYKTGNQFGLGAKTYSSASSLTCSVGGTGLTISTLRAESGSGTEGILGRAIVISEIAAGIESLLSRDFSLGETGIGADLAALLTTILSADSGSAFENSYRYILEIITSSETGAGNEASSLAVAHQLSDAGAGIDAIIARALFAKEYPVNAVDLAKTLTAAIAGVDVGIGVELSLMTYLYQRTDSGHGSDASSLLALFTSGDIGVGAEAITATAAKIAHDTGVSVEAVIAMVKQAIDGGMGAEVLTLVGAVGQAMKLITYLRSYQDLYVYTTT